VSKTSLSGVSRLQSMQSQKEQVFLGCFMLLQNVLHILSSFSCTSLLWSYVNSHTQTHTQTRTHTDTHTHTHTHAHTHRHTHCHRHPTHRPHDAHTHTHPPLKPVSDWSVCVRMMLKTPWERLLSSF